MLNDNIIGSIWYFKIALYSDALELGYHVFNEQDRNKGYMTEAVKLFTDYLFKTKRMNRIQLCTTDGNKPSERVAEKAGFIHEAKLRQFYMLKGKDVDVNLYVKLRDEII